MTQKKQEITIVLPESVADMPVRIVRGNGSSEIIMKVSSSDDERMPTMDTKPKYAFVWEYCGYRTVALDEIEWIEADGSYSRLHLTGNRSMIISFNLAVIGRNLPQEDFIQIHRSYIVSIRHVDSKIGNSLKVGDKLLTIGRGYRNSFFNRFIFVGVRRHRSGM